MANKYYYFKEMWHFTLRKLFFRSYRIRIKLKEMFYFIKLLIYK